MACFIIRETAQPDRLFPIDKPELLIGRGKRADLALPHITVSREHARIMATETGFKVENCSSQDNLLVNGSPLNSAELNTKDTLQIGKYNLVFFGSNLNPLEQFFEGRALDEFPRYARTTAANRKDLTFQMSPTMVKKMMTSTNRIRKAIVKATGTKGEWRPGDKGLRFGKGGDVPASGWFTGGICAELTWNGSDHCLKRCSSLAAITLNGEKLKTEAFLSDGDQFSIGKSNFQYRSS